MEFHLSGVCMTMYTYICAIISMGGLQSHPLTVESHLSRYTCTCINMSTVCMGCSIRNEIPTHRSKLVFVYICTLCMGKLQPHPLMEVHMYVCTHVYCAYGDV